MEVKLDGTIQHDAISIPINVDCSVHLVTSRVGNGNFNFNIDLERDRRQNLNFMSYINFDAERVLRQRLTVSKQLCPW